MDRSKTEELFAKASIKDAVIRNAVPAMLAMIMVLIYNLADTFFIGQTHDALQVAAVSLATPVFLIFMSVGNVFGIGGTSVISRALGEGRQEYARKVCSFCMWSCVAVGAVMTVCFLFGMDWILKIVGASENTWEYTKTYLTIVTWGGISVLISNCFANIVRAEGKPGPAMAGQVIGNLLNVILDPIMIVGLGWGIRGAAIATVIGNVVAAVYYILFYLAGKSSLSISPKHFAMNDRILSGVLAIGIPASLGSLLMSVSQIIMQQRMAAYGDMAVAAAGVAQKVTMITGMICMGIGNGVQPLLGYCIGAHLYDRFKKCLKFSVIFAFILASCMTILCYIFTDQLVSLFLSDASAFSYGVQFVRILLTTSFLFGVFYVLCSSLQAVGAAVPALIVNLSRQGFIYIPALFILQSVFGYSGLIWAQPAADVLSTILVIVLYFHTAKKVLKHTEETEQAAVEA